MKLPALSLVGIGLCVGIVALLCVVLPAPRRGDAALWIDGERGPNAEAAQRELGALIAPIESSSRAVAVERFQGGEWYFNIWVKDASGLPVEGATVRVNQGGDGGEVLSGGLEREQTDSLGHVTLGADTWSLHSIEVSKSGYVSERVLSSPASLCIALARAGTLRVQTFHNWSGEPIAGVVVRPYLLPGMIRFPATRSDAHGFASLEGLPAGDYTLEVSAERYIDYYMHSVRVVADEIMEVGAPLDPGLTLSGTAIDQITGDQLAGGRVQAFVGRQTSAEGQIGTDGSFSLQGLPGLPTSFRVHAEGYDARRAHSSFCRGGAESETELPRVVLHARPVKTLFGRVIADGSPVPNASVIVARSDRFAFDLEAMTSNGKVAVARTDKEGRFSVEVPGTTAGTGRTCACSVLVIAAGYSAEMITLTDQRTDQPLRIHLCRGREVLMRVADAEGNPEVNAHIEWGLLGRHASARRSGESYQFKQPPHITDPDGACRILGVGDGWWQIAVLSADRKRGAVVDLMLNESAATTICCSTSEANVVSGFVVDNRGEPLWDAVIVSDDNPGRRVRPSRDGYFAFPVSGPRSVRLSVYGDALSRPHTFSVSSGHEVRLKVELSRPKVSVQGRVVDHSSGALLARAKYCLRVGSHLVHSLAVGGFFQFDVDQGAVGTAVFSCEGYFDKLIPLEHVPSPSGTLRVEIMRRPPR